ncbi:helix-turn-helix domain-containing protein [Stieleria sp. TO1_6]|uniref:helix-turn-helix domain-containing protein n=1 Tax=Stieleria tagensis TaxID=2956795 RepID=UPI00209B7067|nr:helix-turn-helix domain-containing protein [Stieleria tagensis]MCO8123420.1 helix-turn-helix domain-containing protein [Stieleria tagensis]
MISEQFYTPPQAAKLLGCKSDKVLAWIRSGEIVASNLATDPDGERPRWRIAEDDLARFLLRRRHPSVSEPRAKRKRQTAKRDSIFG